MNYPNPVPKPERRKREPKPLIRKTRMKPVNPERKAVRHEESFGPAGFADWIRSLGCSVPACASQQIEVAHARSRGAGGDWTETLPLCSNHHRLSHNRGVQTFETRFGFRLLDVAGAVHLRWKAFVAEGPRADGLSGSGA